VAALARPAGTDGAGASPHPSSDIGRAFRRAIHETIQRVTDDIEHDFHFNTAISAIMELVNALYAFDAASLDRVPGGERVWLMREAVETVLLLLGPFCRTSRRSSGLSSATPRASSSSHGPALAPRRSGRRK